MKNQEEMNLSDKYTMKELREISELTKKCIIAQKYNPGQPMNNDDPIITICGDDDASEPLKTYLQQLVKEIKNIESVVNTARDIIDSNSPTLRIAPNLFSKYKGNEYFSSLGKYIPIRNVHTRLATAIEFCSSHGFPCTKCHAYKEGHCERMTNRGIGYECSECGVPYFEYKDYHYSDECIVGLLEDIQESLKFNPDGACKKCGIRRDSRKEIEYGRKKCQLCGAQIPTQLLEKVDINKILAQMLLSINTIKDILKNIIAEKKTIRYAKIDPDEINSTLNKLKKLNYIMPKY